MFSTAATTILTAATEGSGLTEAISTTAKAASLVLIVTILGAFYLLTCLIWPFGKCRTCDGTGKRKAPLGSVFRLCRRCEGSGRRVRVGRHVVNRIRETRNAGTKGDRK